MCIIKNGSSVSFGLEKHLASELDATFARELRKKIKQQQGLSFSRAQINEELNFQFSEHREKSGGNKRGSDRQRR